MREVVAPSPATEVDVVAVVTPDASASWRPSTQAQDAGADIPAPSGMPVPAADAGSELCVHLRGAGFDGTVECTVHMAAREVLREKVRANLMTDYGAVVCAAAEARQTVVVRCGAARVGFTLDANGAPCATVTRDGGSGTLASAPGCSGYD